MSILSNVLIVKIFYVQPCHSYCTRDTFLNISPAKLLWLIIAGILLLTGCERKPRIGFIVSSWRTSSAKQKVHGIDDGSAYFGGYREGFAIIIWTDTLACSFPIKPTWDQAGNCAKYAGYIKSPSAPKINVECYVVDRMKGSITINQQQYDLANGALFLLSFRSPQIRVGQIDHDIYAVTTKNLKQLAQDVSEIRAFFETPDMK